MDDLEKRQKQKLARQEKLSAEDESHTELIRKRISLHNERWQNRVKYIERLK
jgi:hypothetical protein